MKDCPCAQANFAACSALVTRFYAPWANFCANNKREARFNGLARRMSDDVMVLSPGLGNIRGKRGKRKGKGRDACSPNGLHQIATILVKIRQMRERERTTTRISWSGYDSSLDYPTWSINLPGKSDFPKYRDSAQSAIFLRHAEVR